MDHRNPQGPTAAAEAARREVFNGCAHTQGFCVTEQKENEEPVPGLLSKTNVWRIAVS